MTGAWQSAEAARLAPGAASHATPAVRNDAAGGQGTVITVNRDVSARATVAASTRRPGPPGSQAGPPRPRDGAAGPQARRGVQ